MSSVLLPIFLLILIGYGAARFRVVGEDGVRAVSDFAFMLFLPALLFRSMARTDFDEFPILAPAAYFGTAVPLFLAIYWVLRRRGVAVAHATVFGMAGIYSNNVMLGVPLIKLAYGDTGFAVLLSIIALHTLVLLTLAALVMELGGRTGGEREESLLETITAVARSAVLHPVILPIIAGFAWAMTGWRLPDAIDSTLALIGGAAPTLCLILLGASLAKIDPRTDLAVGLRLTAAKSLLHPLLMYGIGRWVFELDALALAVLTVCASLPIGANVFLLAQRYRAGQGPVSAGVTLSTIATGATLGPLLGLLAR